MLPRTNLLLAGIIICVLFIGLDLWKKNETPEEALPETKEQVTTPISEWKLFQSTHNKFSVMLPALPQHATDSVPLPPGQELIKYDMYLAMEKSGANYMVSLIQYPEKYEMPSASELLDTLMKEMMNGNPHNKLKMVTKSLFQGNPALEFLIENEEVGIRCKAFLHDRTLVVLTVLDADGKTREERFLKFVNSFSWTDAPANAVPETTLPVTAQ